MKRFLAIAVLLLGAASIGLVAEAQFNAADPLILNATPLHPKPFESVTIVPQSSVINLSSSKVTVTVDGRVVSEGSGAEAAYVTVGGAGTATTVKFTAVANTGQTYSKTITFRPADVALVVEAASTVHPFYKGAPLVAGEGPVRLIAIPELRTSGGSLVPASSLVYEWKNGPQVLQEYSGIGKSVLSVTSPVKYRNVRITLIVSTQDKSIVAESNALIAPADPLVRVYRNDPLLGPLYGNAVQESVKLVGAEETFRAVPYFFPNAPAITWTVNNSVSDSDEDVTFRASGQGMGSARIAAMASAMNSSAEANFSIDFGEDDGFSIFGI